MSSMSPRCIQAATLEVARMFPDCSQEYGRKSPRCGKYAQSDLMSAALCSLWAALKHDKSGGCVVRHRMIYWSVFVVTGWGSTSEAMP